MPSKNIKKSPSNGDIQSNLESLQVDPFQPHKTNLNIDIDPDGKAVLEKLQDITNAVLKNCFFCGYISRYLSKNHP